MEITLDRYPEGRQKALTMSYDDGIYDDIRLIEIFNKNGIKGTFHINGGLFWKKDWNRMDREDVLRAYKGHEISGHGFEHKKLTILPDEGIINEIIHDRESLEDITGTPIRGMSYAFGDVDDRVERIIRSLGIEYARVVPTTGKFDIPANFLRWEGTCHHGDHLMERGEEFLKQTPYQMMLMYVWGHSFEFAGDNSWGLMEDFCAMMGGHEEIWYATNIEICDYVKAVRSLHFTVKQDVVYNPTALDVWISADGKPVKVPAGETIRLS